MLTNDFKQLITEVDKIGDGDDFILDQLLKQSGKLIYQRNSTTTIIQNLTPVEAIAEFDLIEEVVNLAHDEDINLWVEEVGRFLQGSLEINTLEQIVEQTDLSLVQVFMALLFGDFELERGSKKFYSISFIVYLLKLV